MTDICSLIGNWQCLLIEVAERFFNLWKTQFVQNMIITKLAFVLKHF